MLQGKEIKNNKNKKTLTLDLTWKTVIDNSIGSGKLCEHIKVNVGGNQVDFIIDSGASVNIIDKKQWE